MTMAIKKETYLPVSGIQSEHDAMIIERETSRLDGVVQSRVELNNQRVFVATIKDDAPISAISIIRKLGYEVPLTIKTFAVLEMSCAACAISVESMINTLPGVVSASVNYAAAQLKVEYAPDTMSPADFQSALRQVGYDLLIDESEDEPDVLEALRISKFARLKKKTIWAMIFSVPLMIIGMVLMDIPYAAWIMWALATPVVFVFGRDFYVNAWKQATHRSVNMDTLVALSTGAAYLFSVFNTLFPSFWSSKGLEAHVYFEAAAVIIAFILLGRLLEERAKGNTSTAIKKLMGLQPKWVTIVESDGSHIERSISQVRVGDLIVIKPGEKVAVDGIVTDGNSYVDESMLSGEPVPVLKETGNQVFAGTNNQKGSFRMKAAKVGSDTVLAHIIKTVQEAQGSKAPVQKLVDKIAGIFVPVVILIAVVAFVAWLILGGQHAFAQAMLSLITVLIIACPCALGLATPTAIMVGVGKGAEKGVLIKDAESLELLRSINAMVLDKTGTITIGKPVVNHAYWHSDGEEAKRALLAVERQSEHPLAAAVVSHLFDVYTVVTDEFESITGKGVRAKIGGEEWFVGNRRLLDEKGISIDAEILKKGANFEQEGETTIWVASQHGAVAVLGLSDRLKEGSLSAIRHLKESGIEVYMLTGDNETTARVMAQKAGIEHFKAGVLPVEKADFIAELQNQGKTVAMVGDGINDSTALARADVGIAMAQGSDIAMDVAKMTIISSDLMRIPEAIKLSKATVATIRQNLFWAFFYNVLGIPIAAGVLYPINGFLLSPMIAGAAMALSSVFVVSNSLRLKIK